MAAVTVDVPVTEAPLTETLQDVSTTSVPTEESTQIVQDNVQSLPVDSEENRKRTAEEMEKGTEKEPSDKDGKVKESPLPEKRSGWQDGNGDVPVKAQYLVKVTNPEERVVIDDDGAERTAHGEEGELQEKGNEARKKMRGQNKSRDNTRKRDITTCVCPPVAQGKPCLREGTGKPCSFVHDLAVFSASKQPDLGEACPSFEQHGFCKFGIACRYSKNHVDPVTLVNLKDEDKFAKNPILELNKLDKEAQIDLRKFNYAFPRSDAAVKELQAEGLVPESKYKGKKGPKLLQLEAENKTEEVGIKLRPQEKKKLDWSNKTYLAPLTTVGNLPFRYVCKMFGADITCGEMAMCTNLLQGQQSEWALLKRHPSEDFFGVQVCGGYADVCSKTAELISNTCSVDYIDLNSGCPIDLVFQKGMGSGLMDKPRRLESIVRGMVASSDCAITVKLRAGVNKNPLSWTAHNLIPKAYQWGASAVVLHGRSREQRYTKLAAWDYVATCTPTDTTGKPFFGNGDVMSWQDADAHMTSSKLSGVMVARGALIKPWIFTEIKEKRDWDISSSERLDMLRRFVNTGLMHWGSDEAGVEKVRRFLMEWLSFLYRYVPVGLLEVVPQQINDRPPVYVGRDDLETLMASPRLSDWIKITEMLLGPVPSDYAFVPKHKANSY